MLAADFLEAVADRIEKVLVRREDRTVHFEFDDGLGFAQSLDRRAKVARRREQHGGCFQGVRLNLHYGNVRSES